MFKKSLISVAVAVTLAACGGSSNDNEAPTAVNLSKMTVDENAVGATIGELSATDANSGDTHTFTTTNDKFVISGSTLSLADNVSLDYEKAPSIKVEVKATDAAGASFTQELTLTVADKNIVIDNSFPQTYKVADSISYSGQVARHLLINELNNYIGAEVKSGYGLQKDLDDGVFASEEKVLEKLISYYDGDWELEVADRALTTSTTPDAKQGKFGDISSSSKNLNGKIAGNDKTGQHKDWSTDFVAFGAKGSQSPEQLIRALLAEIAKNAGEAISGNVRQDQLGNDITKVYLAADGRDLKQLVQKILLGSVAFSQGADDYLDDDTENKGLRTDHSKVVDGKTYTNLEHQFDEGFGYFGAAHDYLAYTDEEIAKKGGRDDHQGMHDTDSDSMIDFLSEFNFGHSQNAAKRDRGSVGNAKPTDLTNEAMVAFIAGRKLLADTAGKALEADQMLELQGFRDLALMAWEKSIAATAIHYINDTTDDYDNFGTDSFKYTNLAKHWSELKGFVVSLQFNPRSPLTDAQHEEVNRLIKDAPVLKADELDAYKADLIKARDILRDAYSFEAENAEKW